MARPTWLNAAYVALFSLMIAAWVIQLAGVGASQSSCTKILNNANNRNNFQRRLAEETFDPVAEVGRKVLAAPGRQLLASNSETCSNQFSLIWWTVWFQFLCIGLGVMVSVSSMLQQRFGLTVVLFFVISTTILMGSAKTAGDTIFNNKDNKNSDVEDYVAAARAGMAGTVMLMVFNFIFIIVSTDSFGTYAPTLSLPTHNGPSNDKATAAAAPVAAAAAPSVSMPSAAGPVPSGTPTYSPASSPMPASYVQQQQQPIVTEPAPQAYPSYAGSEQVTAHVAQPEQQPAKQW